MNTLFWVFAIISAVAGVILLIRHQQIVAKKCTVKYYESLSARMKQVADDVQERLTNCRNWHEQWLIKDGIYRHLYLIKKAVEFMDTIKSHECFRRQPAKARNQQTRALTSLRQNLIASRDRLTKYLNQAIQTQLPTEFISFPINSI